MRAIVAICIFLASAGCGTAAEEKGPADALTNCVIQKALDLASGPDAADLIARSSVLLCDHQMQVLMLSFGKKPDEIDAATRLADHVQKSAVDQATLSILRFRAHLNRKK